MNPQSDTNTIDSFINAGISEIQRENYEAAARTFLKAHTLAPDDIDVILNIAEAYRLAEQHPLSKEFFHKAHKLEPRDTQLNHALAELYAIEENWELAARYISVANRNNIEDPEIPNLQGVILDRLEKLSQARDSFQRAIDIDSNFFDAWCNLGSVNYQLEYIREAVECFQRAEEIHGLDKVHLELYCQALIAEGSATLAIKKANELLLIAGHDTYSLVLRARAYSTLGKFELAKQDCRHALRQNTNNTGAYSVLSDMRALTSRDGARIRDLLSGSQISDQEKIELCYSGYRFERDEKNYDTAFKHLLQANRLGSELAPTDIEKTRENTSSIIRNFNKDVFCTFCNAGHEGKGPIFIVGMPRSGTTLTERIVSAHSGVYPGGEEKNIGRILREISYPNGINTLSKNWFHTSGTHLFNEMISRRHNYRFATDKMPFNYKHLGIISLLLPNAKIIYCKRHPVDNCFSCFEQNFSRHMSFATSFEGLATAYLEHERVMDHWHKTLPIPIHTVRYEDLVSNPEAEARAMIDYIGLDWDPACLSPESVDATIATASVWQARQPIYSGSVQKWKKFEKHLQPLIDLLEAPYESD